MRKTISIWYWKSFTFYHQHSRNPSSLQHWTPSHCDVLFPSEKYRISSTWSDYHLKKMVSSARKMVGSMASRGCFSPKPRSRNSTEIPHLFSFGIWWYHWSKWQTKRKLGARFITLPCWFEGWPQLTQFQHDSWSLSQSSHLRFRLSVQAMVPGLSCMTINGHFRNLNWRCLPYIRPI